MDNKKGFTLIELSIVLVIIGLVVGGVLVGRDLISAAAVRAQISQLEKFQTAVNTFKGKYNALPGDMNNTDATTFGFSSRASTAGKGDSNGILYSLATRSMFMYGETLVFWTDLSTARLIDGSFTTDMTFVGPSVALTPASTNPGISYYVPSGAISGTYLLTGNYECNSTCLGVGGYGINNTFLGVNYFSLQRITNVATNGTVTGASGLSVAQAYGIDKKIDDGLPTVGTVLAMMIHTAARPYWTATQSSPVGAWTTLGPPAAPLFSSATSCYDTDADSSTVLYSVAWGGSSPNCSLSIRIR